LALYLSCSWPTSFNSFRLEQLCQPLARVEHARLHRVLRDADDLGDLLDRFLVVVHEIDDLPVFRRKSREAPSEYCTLVLLLQPDPWIVCRILDRAGGLFVQLLIRTPPEGGEGLEARDRQHPCRHSRTPFEPTSLPPHVQKHLADQVLRHGLV